MNYPIENDSLNLSIDGQVETCLVTELLLQVLVIELNNIMVSSPEEGGIMEAIDSDNNIIISYSTLGNILPHQLKKMTDQYKVICGCECCISEKSMHGTVVI